jgi:excisionase family DNA binding protein
MALASPVMTERQMPDMLSPEEAARLLGISPRTLARWAREHRIPAVILPTGHRRYRVADIEAVLHPRASA